MATYYDFGMKDGVCRAFTSESVLIEWLENYFENGNEISVHGEYYSYLDCIELV